MQNQSHIYLGVMSGTSLDGIDIAAVHISPSGKQLEVLAFESQPFTAEIRRELRQLIGQPSHQMRTLVAAHKALGHIFADAIDAFLAQHKLAQIDVIGLHGLTLWHQADPVQVLGQKQRGTLQLGDPYVVAQQTGIPVVHDLRNADMALGGEGAPLAPYLDILLFASKEENRILLNLGGIANATFIPAGSQQPLAFDTGPANMISDALMEHHPQQPASYDKDGQTAAKGKVIPALLDRCLRHPYFAKPHPKTTGRELFGEPFLQSFLDHKADHPHADLVATATYLSAKTIAMAIKQVSRQQELRYDRVIAAGGGIHNRTLMKLLAHELGNEIAIDTTEHHGIDPDSKEAVLFAALAWANINGKAGNFPSVSGAERPVILGSRYIP